MTNVIDLTIRTATDADLEAMYRRASNQGEGDRADAILEEIDRRAAEIDAILDEVEANPLVDTRDNIKARHAALASDMKVDRARSQFHIV